MDLQNNMFEKYSFLPTFNSTFVYDEDKERAKIIHEIVFQKYGKTRKFYRSKRLKVLRELFYPDVIDETGSYFKKSLKEIIHGSKVDSDNVDHGASKPQTFCVITSDRHHMEMEDNFINNSIEAARERTYTQSVGSEDISDLLSVRSIYFSNTKSPCKSVNDDNNNTIKEESNEVDEEAENLLHCIDAQDLAIQEFDKVLTFGRRKRGFAGSIPHIQAEKGRLVANLRKQALVASLDDQFHCSSLRKKHLKGKITIANIKCDTNVVCGYNQGIPPCYYLCIVQHQTTVMCTDVLAPDMHGIVEFSSRFILGNVTNDFSVKLLLFKLQLNPDTKRSGWRLSFRRRQIALPTLLLVGNYEISLSNLNKTAFPFDNEIVYANFTPSIHIANHKEGYLTVQRLARKTKIETKVLSHKRWCVLDGTDFKVYRWRSDVDYLEPIEIIPLAYCKSCERYSLSRTLKLEFIHAYFGRTLYLVCDDEKILRDWLSYIKTAILFAKTFGL